MDIKHKYTNDILHTIDADTLIGANLFRANLGGANLRGADLIGANLGFADFRGAILGFADLSGANLGGANLRGADLSGADLSGTNLNFADLRGAILRGANLRGEILTKTPILISNLTWDILITSQYLTIGCQRHTHKEWKKFTDDDITIMESRASEFWKVNKKWILGACKAHRESE